MGVDGGLYPDFLKKRTFHPYFHCNKGSSYHLLPVRLSRMDYMAHGRWSWLPGGPFIDSQLAAMVSTDIVGYSRLMPVEEAGTLARLETHCRIHGC